MISIDRIYKLEKMNLERGEGIVGDGDRVLRFYGYFNQDNSGEIDLDELEKLARSKI